jgi:hypothetical protein
MHAPRDWQAIAFNTSPDSDNRIHSDEMAQSYGFKGGLVPGVVVSAYLIHPGVQAWGMEWLTRGHSKVVIHKPTYDGDSFDVKLTDISDSSYQSALLDSTGTLNASGEVSLTRLAEPPTMRGDVLVEPKRPPSLASLETMHRLQEVGMSALEVCWDQNCEIPSYLKDARAMPALHQAKQGDFANAGFMLGLTNWALAANVYMNPWIHLQTESQFYAAVRGGTLLQVECDIQALFEKRGHKFVDLNVSVFVQKTGQPVMSALLRAIYKMRSAD